MVLRLALHGARLLVQRRLDPGEDLCQLAFLHRPVPLVRAERRTHRRHILLPVGLALDLIVGEGCRAHPARQVTLNDVGEKGTIDIGRLGITRTRSIALHPFETALAHQKADIFKDAQRARDLIAQMLAFARRQRGERRTLALAR